MPELSMVAVASSRGCTMPTIFTSSPLFTRLRM